VAEPAARVVPVEILGQRYPIRSTLDAAYVAALATYVDAKMRAAAEAVPTGDSVRLAVLAALNIADEYFRCRDAQDARQSTLNERAARVEQLLDLALDRLGAPDGGGS
jgi:cell division protein ZapA